MDKEKVAQVKLGSVYFLILSPDTPLDYSRLLDLAVSNMEHHQSQALAHARAAIRWRGLKRLIEKFVLDC